MKKSLFSIVIIMLLLLVVLPVSVEAATLLTSKKEMNVGETVEVIVNIKKPVELVQFDLKFDNTKYQYVNGSAQSNLESTESNLISENTVRVSALDLSGNKTNQLTMKFKAIKTGGSIPFSIGGIIELGEKGTTEENFENIEVIVNKIGEKTEDKVEHSEQEIETIKTHQYLDNKGNIITTLPKTGESSVTGRKISIGVFKTLVDGELVVPYALKDSDNTISINDLKEEFGDATTNETDCIKTGSTFQTNNQKHTTIVYGDVNKDGRVTTSDAMKIRKICIRYRKCKF